MKWAPFLASFHLFFGCFFLFFSCFLCVYFKCFHRFISSSFSFGPAQPQAYPGPSHLYSMLAPGPKRVDMFTIKCAASSYLRWLIM